MSPEDAFRLVQLISKASFSSGGDKFTALQLAESLVPKAQDKDSDDEFVRMIVYFWKEKADPTRFTGFDQERMERLMPTFAHAWKRYQFYEALVDQTATHYG